MVRGFTRQVLAAGSGAILGGWARIGFVFRSVPLGVYEQIPSGTIFCCKRLIIRYLTRFTLFKNSALSGTIVLSHLRVKTKTLSGTVFGCKWLDKGHLTCPTLYKNRALSGTVGSPHFRVKSKTQSETATVQGRGTREHEAVDLELDDTPLLPCGLLHLAGLI